MTETNTAGKLRELTLQSEAIGVLGRRLTARFPEGAQAAAHTPSVMGAAPDLEKETCVTLEHEGEKMMMVALELFALVGDDFTASTQAQVEKWQKAWSTELEVEAKASAADVQLRVITPKSWDRDSDMILARGVLVQHSDGCAQYLAFYVDAAAGKDIDGARALADRIIDTVAVGAGEPLHREAGVRDFVPLLEEPHVKFVAPDGYVTTTQRGPDFVVRHIRRLRRLGEGGAGITIYFGRHPRYHFQARGFSGEPKKVKGSIFGEGIEWLRWEDGEITQETILGFGLENEKEPRIFMHVSATAGDLKGVMELAALISKFVSGAD